MSLSKYQSIGDNSRRDSFGHRISDELCQTILQNLSSNDKCELEFVSKQFQRIVLDSKMSIAVDPFQSDIEDLEQMLKKNGQNINTLFFGQRDWDYCEEEDESNDMMELIIKYCDNLTHFEYNFKDNSIDEEIQKKFIDKFGNKLISFDIFCPEICFTLTEASNIEELRVWRFYSQLSEIEFNKLKSFKVETLFAKDLDQFEVFIERNAKTLKHLDIDCDEIDEEDDEEDNDEDNDKDNNEDKSSERLLKIISKAINLVHLSVKIAVGNNDKLYDNYLLWNQIAINCKQIKSLKLVLEVEKSLIINDKMLSILKQFKELKRLELMVNHNNYRELIVNLLPIGDFEGLEGLTHLTLLVNYRGVVLKEKILAFIYITFPKLKYLCIRCPFIASEWTAQILRRLPSLETIGLAITDEQMIPQIEAQLIQNCKRFKKFYNLNEK